MKLSKFYSLFSKQLLSKHLIFILCVAWASNAFAYLKINYNSGELIWLNEELRFGDDDYVYYGDFLIDQTIGFNIDLIIPDVDFPTSGFAQFAFDDVITNISTTNLFGAPLATNSSFELIHEDPSLIYWVLTFDLIDSAPLENGTARGGSFAAGGSLVFNPDGSGIGSGGGANFSYYWDNWLYRRQQQEFLLNTDAYFAAFDTQLTVEKVLVPEPSSLALLMAGLAFIAFRHRQNKRK